MRILLVSTSVVPLGTQRYGGIEKMLWDWAYALIKRGHEVKIAAPYGSIVPEGAELIETVHLPQEQDRDEITNQILTKRYLVEQRFDFDVVHDFSHLHVLRSMGMPAVHMIWDPIVCRYDFKATNKVVCVSEWQAARYEKMYGRKALVMPPWVNTEVYTPASHPRRERLLYVGKLTPEKGADIAIGYAVDRHSAIDVVGGLIHTDSREFVDWLKKMESRLPHEGLRVFYNATEEEKIALMQNAKAVIYSPRQLEAHCLVGMESWACGTPFVVKDEGPLNEIFAPVPNLREEAVRRWSFDSVVPQWIELYWKVKNGKSW